MRDYSKVSGTFWTGKTGKSIRGDSNAQIVAMYLMTSPHANMIGVFYCPIGYIHLDTGLSIEGASKGLQRLIEGGFCTIDSDSDMVYVHEMATYQIGDSLKPTDNRVKDIQKQYDNLSESLIKQGFFDKYSKAFCLNNLDKLASPLEAPSKPETGTEAGTEEILGEEKQLPPIPKKQIGKLLPKDWVLPKAWGEWAMNEKPTFTKEQIRVIAETFKDHWLANSNQSNSKKADWEATWRNWVRRQPAPSEVKKQDGLNGMKVI
jgi:hypothetical protein